MSKHHTINTLLGKAISCNEQALHIQPLITTQTPEAVDELVQRAVHMDPDYRPTDFSAWYQVQLEIAPGFAQTASEQVDKLICRLHDTPEIESVSILRAGPPPMQVMPADDPRSSNQGYLDAAPGGIDARYAWGFDGGNGEGIGFVDLEQGWNLKHEDLEDAGITLISGTNSAYYSHGTAVLGEVLMVDNTLGGVGIAPKAIGRVISQHRPGGYNTATTIIDAVAHMQFGDVLLLEAQEYDPVDGKYFWPVEVSDANYEAIRLATALGIIVIEAGCNGSYDLDAYKDLNGNQIFNRSSSNFRNSGAIMVGAGSSTSPHTRLDFSNYGTRIDVFAWGENVDTTNTDTAGTDNDDYTSSFSGTSSASPIISGAALILQGIASDALQRRFSPTEMRRIMTTGGTPSSNPSTDLIGVMPNLRAIIDSSVLNLAPDVYLRDYVGDTGNPTSGAISQSPDIIIRRSAITNPGSTFGEGSGTENDQSLSDPVLAGTSHSIYLRLLNRGGSPAFNVSVDLYWSLPSTLVTPNLWNRIGTTTLPTIPTNNVLVVSDEILWPTAAIPRSGHYCFVAVAGNAQDPPPTTAAFASWDNWIQYVGNNNNIAWRNFDVVATPPSDEPDVLHIFQLVIPGAFDKARRFRIETVGALPRRSKVELIVPLALARQLRVKLFTSNPEECMKVARLQPFGCQVIGDGVLMPKSIAKCELRIQVPNENYDKHKKFDFALRQLYEGHEVGRITWRIGQYRVKC